jgi:hypothetical protein
MTTLRFDAALDWAVGNAEDALRLVDLFAPPAPPAPLPGPPRRPPTDDERTDSGEDTDGFEMDCTSDEESGDEALLGRRRDPNDHFGTLLRAVTERSRCSLTPLKDVRLAAVVRLALLGFDSPAYDAVRPLVRTFATFKAEMLRRGFFICTNNGRISVDGLRVRA